MPPCVPPSRERSGRRFDAVFVPTLSKLFFPTVDPSVGVLLSLSTFASAWLVRPLGAMVIGAYADRAGRKPAMVLSAVLMTYPLFLWILDGPTLTKLIVIQSLLALVIYSGYDAIVPSLLSDLFQVRRRKTGISLAYVLGQQTGNAASPGLYLTGIIMLSLVCLTQCNKLGIK